MRLSDRQRRVLAAVVELHVATGRPVGSRALVDAGAVRASSSTVRYELGRLEELGLLEHPHTSAGRIPTDTGFRLYVDELMGAPVAPGPTLAVTDVATRIDDALRSITRELASATGQLAVITAPRTSGAVIRHVEVLQLQPTVVLVVVITAAGDVERYSAVTDHPVDPGLVEWAGEYLNERVAGLAIGEHRLRQRLRNPELGPMERAMLDLIAPVFDEFDARDQDIVVGGGEHVRPDEDVQRIVQLVAMLDDRRRLLSALRPLVERGAPSLNPGRVRSVAISIGEENNLPELRRLSVVGAAYGVGARPLGMVGIVGPRAMDYRLTSQLVARAASGLSAVAETFYEA